MSKINDQEIEKRIFEMEQSDYKFPKPMNAMDYIWVIVICIVCFIGIIGGAYL